MRSDKPCFQRDRVRRAAGVLFAAGALAFAGAAVSQSGAYPSKPMRIVVPAVAGSSADVLARIVGERVARVQGQPWIVDNRPGAGGIIGSDVVSKAPPDGYTLLFTANNFIISPSLYSAVPYDVYRDFAPDRPRDRTPNVIFIDASRNVKTIGELVALAKRTPGGLDYGAPFVGTAAHLLMEMFKRAAGVELTFVPTKGTPQAFTEAIAGRVPLVIGNVSDGGAHVKAGKLNALAVGDGRRSRLLPDVPTLGEAGYPGLDISLWFALYGPARMPADIIAQLNRDLVKLLGSPEVGEALESRGFEPRPSSPKELEALMRREQPLFAKVIADAAIKVQ